MADSDITHMVALVTRADAIELARAAERAADKAFAAGDDNKACRLYRTASKGYARAGMAHSAKTCTDAAKACARWGAR